VAVLKIPDNFHYYLSMHEECNERILARAKNLRAEEVEVSQDHEVVRIKKMANAVIGEAHRMKAFVRLSSFGSSALYGFFKPRHKIGEHICDHFASRNAGIMIVLGNGRESWIALSRESRIWRDHGGGMAATLEKLKAALHCSLDGSNKDRANNQFDDRLDGRSDVEGLWQIYYDSQYCPERKNLTAFKRHMPRRDQEAAGLRLIQNKKNATLDDFLDD
jgi:probable DNA metabolism protein